MAKATKEKNTLHPKRGAFPTPRNVLADATPYKPEQPDESGVTVEQPSSGSDTSGTAEEFRKQPNRGSGKKMVRTGGIAMSDKAGAQRGAGNVGTPGTPPPPSGSAGAGSQQGAGNVGTPGTPPPPSGSAGAGSRQGAGNVGTPGTPPPPSGSAGAGSQGGASNVGTPGTPPPPN